MIGRFFAWYANLGERAHDWGFRATCRWFGMSEHEIEKTLASIKADR